jgi:hypothetical protein
MQFLLPGLQSAKAPSVAIIEPRKTMNIATVNFVIVSSVHSLKIYSPTAAIFHEPGKRYVISITP